MLFIGVYFSFSPVQYRHFFLLIATSHSVRYITLSTMLPIQPIARQIAEPYPIKGIILSSKVSGEYAIVTVFSMISVPSGSVAGVCEIVFLGFIVVAPFKCCFFLLIFFSLIEAIP